MIDANFDHLFHITRDAASSLRALSGKKIASIAEKCEDDIQSTASKLKDLVQLGLGNRGTVDIVEINELDQHEDAQQPHILTFGILLHPERYMETLERGPEANTVEGLKFKEFWGDIAKLRRFPDGSIVEAVLWSCGTIAEKRMICSRIVKHVLQRHAAIDPRRVKYLGNLWQDCLHLQRVELPPEWPRYGAGEEYLDRIVRVYDKLTADLRKMKDLPLAIVSVRSIAPSVRFTELFPPLPATFTAENRSGNRRSIQPYVQTIPVQIVMEGSSRWPEDREAVRRLKSAFQLQMGENLKQDGYHVVMADAEELRVWKDGYCFVLEIFFFGEMQMARRVTLPDGRMKLEDTTEFRELQLKWELFPKLSSALLGIARQHESFGTACRLAKRWIKCQLFGGYINDETVELLMAYVYIHPAPSLAVPVAPERGFIRFLRLLATFDWLKYPLPINFNQEMSASEVESMERDFTADRQNNLGPESMPPMSLVIPFERTSVWTRKNPPALIVKRLRLVAKASLDEVQAGLLTGHTWDPKVIFRSDLKEGNGKWDVLIYLRRNFVSRRYEALDSMEKDPEVKPLKRLKKKKSGVPALKKKKMSLLKYSSSPGNSDVVLDLDSVKTYVDRLESAYGDYAYFMTDQSSCCVAVKWKKHAFSSIPLSATRQFNCHAVSTKITVKSENGNLADGLPSLTLNHTAVLEDFNILGRGLVETVEVRSDNWTI